MSLGTRLRAAASALWQPAGLPWLGDRIEAGHASIPVATAPASYLALTGVYRACSLLSDAVSLAPPNIYALDGGGGRTKLTLDDPQARALSTLSHNDAEMFAFSTALLGNGFLLIQRDQRKRPVSLVARPTWRVSLEQEQGSNRCWYRVAADASVGEDEAIYSEDDIIHARYRMTGSSRGWGVPPVVSCSPAFALALQSRAVQRHLFDNLSRPGGVLQADGKITPEVSKQMRQEWDDAYRNGGTGKVAVLSNGLKYVPLVWNASDAQLLEQVKASTADIARAYSIPRNFLEDDQPMTYASASEATRSLYSLALRHFAARIADAITGKLLTPEQLGKGARVEYDLSSSLILPGGEMAEFLSKLVNAGILSANEVRNQYLAMPDIEGGDVLRAPANTLPAPTWAAEPTTPTPTK